MTAIDETPAQRDRYSVGASGKPGEVQVDIDLASKPKWFLQLSPTGKVPLLQISHHGEADEVLFESMAICEYLEETQGGTKLYSTDPLARAKQRAWIEFGSATLSDAWQFISAKDDATAERQRTGFRKRLETLERVLTRQPWFDGETFGMVDVVFAPIFRYFDTLNSSASEPIFSDLELVMAWRASLRARGSVSAAVKGDYAERLRTQLRQHEAILAE
ncbi:glutathione S-transferase family protein [Neorhizobium sp. DAR64872/K0K18]|uniref:glutathione S-transferase family protein n=1 Tax=Neorhizobium sp. DAR64872/K0K18 TaxID=3421958 RepID=UPI003D27FC72